MKQQAGFAQHARSARGAIAPNGSAFNANPLLTVGVAGVAIEAVVVPAFRARSLRLPGRSFYLMAGVSTGFLQRQGEARYARTLEMPATRGRITDRNGVVLASSVPARAVWAIPEDVDASAGPIAMRCAACCRCTLGELKRRLADEDRTFVYLRAPGGCRRRAERIAALKLAGIHSTREFKRHYPEGATNAHVIGFTNVEDKGQEGIELAHERRLPDGRAAGASSRIGSAACVEDDWLREPLDGNDSRCRSTIASSTSRTRARRTRSTSRAPRRVRRSCST